MSKIILPKDHYCLKITSDVAEICQPLAAYGITYFAYYRYFDDDDSACPFTSHKDSFLNHMTKEYTITPPIPEKIISKRFYYLAMPDTTDNFNQTFFDYYFIFKIGYPLYLIERFDNYFDLFIFGTTSDNPKIINFYFNNIDVLENFTFYFKDKASKLIEKSHRNRLIIPKHMQPTFGSLIAATKEDDEKQKLLKQITARHYKFNLHREEISFTKREIDSLKFLAYGQTVKEIAKSMNVSPRTIETHLNNVKLKLNCNKKSEILKLISEHILK